MRKLSSRLSVCVLMSLGVSCVSVGPSEQCGPGDKAIYLDEDTVDHLSDAEVQAILTRNEQLAARGCAKPN